LAAIQKERKGAELFFVMGEDALADLPNWRDPDRIVELAMLAVARRPDVAANEGGYPDLVAIAPGRVVWLTMPAISVSASDIRRRVAAGMSIRYRVPPAVEDYIREKRLYLD
jgi:nicotinate-nucleotide adenylyltransferase